ncbi:hypothetical protein BJ912DRAFT_1038909 [Pholiota molesta]|nr:hypothetical protein BJ912DRAFT_1038909 [Pholiota molesta]
MKSMLISLLQQQHPLHHRAPCAPPSIEDVGRRETAAPRTTRHHAHRRQPSTRACHVITGLRPARTRSPRRPTQQPTERPRLATHRKARHPIAHQEVPPPRAGERAPQKREGGGRRGRASEAPRRARSAPTSAAIGHSRTPCRHPAPNPPSPPPPPIPPPPPHPAAAAAPPPRPPRPSPPHGATPPPPTSTTTPTAASTATATSRRRSSGSCSTSALARPATAGSRARATTGAGWVLGRDGKVKERSGRHQDTPSNIHSDERQGMKNRGKTRQEGDPKAPCLLPSASAHSPPPYPFAAAIPIRYHCPPHPPQVHEAAEGDDRPPLSPLSPSDAVHLNPSHGITVGGDVGCWRHG